MHLVDEHSDYIQHDPLSLFYLVFFCVFFKNMEIYRFLKMLIFKMGTIRDKTASGQVNTIIDMIDQYGFEMLRQVGEKPNRILYHMAMYNAFDDDLRILYSPLIKKMQFVSLRDEDGLKLLSTRDYELIKLCLGKYVPKITNLPFINLKPMPISHNYRVYNPAYFEEIILKLQVDERVAQNYRE